MSYYSYVYVPVNKTIKNSGVGAEDAGKPFDERNKEVIFGNCAPLTDCISEKNNTQVDNANDIDVVRSMYDLTEYSDNCSRTSWRVWQY